MFIQLKISALKKEGLDISKEKFKEEYAILRNVGLFQPYQTGNLLFCELSKASFGYAQYAPERLIYSLGGNIALMMSNTQLMSILRNRFKVVCNLKIYQLSNIQKFLQQARKCS